MKLTPDLLMINFDIHMSSPNNCTACRLYTLYRLILVLLMHATSCVIREWAQIICDACARVACITRNPADKTNGCNIHSSCYHARTQQS